MTDINELREKINLRGLDVVADTDILAVLDRLEEAESDALEQARLNGMGSEREAALMAKLEAAEKDAALKEEVIDSLAAVVKRLDAQCDAAERERDECNRRRLEAADHFAAQTALMKKKYDTLRAKIAEMEKQEPAGYGVRYVEPTNGEEDWDSIWKYRVFAEDHIKDFTQAYADVGEPVGASTVVPLYTLPGAQIAPSIHEGVRKVTLGFRWESEAQHHIPTIEIEFDPVSPDSPNDAKGWQDRDRIASMLSPEAKP